MPRCVASLDFIHDFGSVSLQSTDLGYAQNLTTTQKWGKKKSNFKLLHLKCHI